MSLLNKARTRATFRADRLYGHAPSFVLVAATLAAHSAYAQTAQLEEIVVTGTRIIRDGYEAPTPLTVVGLEEIQTTATANIGDFVNTLPAFAGSNTPTGSTNSVSPGTAGLNALNLRNLGLNRTLVLLDGQRSVGANLTGNVDINDFPQSLVSRVDVVTAGASAAYGSDALSGVVNFILDKQYTGLKGEASGGITTYGDDRSFQVYLTGGTGFAGGRGHLLINGEVSGVDGIPYADRDWNLEGWQFMTNPAYTRTNGQPERLLLPKVGLSNQIVGGIVTSGPLKGTAFGPAGAPYQFNYGDLVFDPDMRGGDWNSSQAHAQLKFALDPKQTRQSAFTRISYNVTDSVEVFAQFAWAHAGNESPCCPMNAISTIRADNAFIPAATALQMQSLGLTSLSIGSMNFDLPRVFTHHERRLNRNVIGASGSFDAFNAAWNWDAYFQNGVSRQTNRAKNVWSTSHLALALDAVRHPTTGAIVCRSTLANPGNGCVPYNLFGIGVNSDAAVHFVQGQGGFAYRNERFTQNVYAGTIRGEPFSIWAGPVSLAFGVEHRSEAVTGIADEISSRNGWFAGNFLATHGSYTVTEGFVETVVPLAQDAPWAKALDLNAAVRATDYSLSGYVSTWKVGATYSPVDAIRIRVTRSRDIRAPNLAELFSTGGGAAARSILNPFNNNASEIYTGSTPGSLDLKPEKSDTTGIGVVLQPTSLPGLSASVDYWNLNIKDAIGSLAFQQIVDNCFIGNQEMCSVITFAPNSRVITHIVATPFNLITQIARGIDFEGSYRVPLDAIIADWSGNLTVRLLATHYLKNYSSNGINIPTDSVGENFVAGPPNWRWTGSVNYALDPVSVTISARGVSAGVYNNSFIECTTGCPPSTVDNRTVNDNHIDGALYFDAAFAYKFALGDGGTEMEAFVNVKNIADKDPPVVAVGPGGNAFRSPAANNLLYDVIGRQFRAGLRFRM